MVDGGFAFKNTARIWDDFLCVIPGVISFSLLQTHQVSVFYNNADSGVLLKLFKFEYLHKIGRYYMYR